MDLFRLRVEIAMAFFAGCVLKSKTLHGLRTEEFVPQGLVGVEGPSHGEDDRSRTVAVLFGTNRFFRLS